MTSGPGNDRLDRLSDYPFTRLTRLLADVTPAPGRTPITLSLGEPQHAPPDLIDHSLRANAALWGKYPPVNGTEAFRAAVGAWLERRYRLPPGLFDAERSVLPVAGTREALFQAALLAVPERKAGQRPAVLLPNPFYAVYEGAGLLAGGDPVFLPAFRDTGFLPDLAALPPALLERTALFYLCSPGNPQGAAADRGYFTRAIALARRYNFILAVDECYAEIYGITPPIGALQVAAELATGQGAGGTTGYPLGRTTGSPLGGTTESPLGGTTGTPWSHLLVFHSLSKRSNAAGLRSGFVAGDPALIARFARLRSYANAGTPLPVLAAATALWQEETHVEENRNRYRAKFDAAAAALNGRLGFYRPDGGFFLWLDVGCGEQACRRLWAEAAIRVLPGAYLSRPVAAASPSETAHTRNPGAAYIRVALVDEADRIHDACCRIAALL